jgi:homoserine kinase
MKELTIFTPATIANLSCGFDILGLALDTVGDYMTIKRTTEPGIRIKSIIGQQLPTDPFKNVAGVAGLALLAETDKSVGFEISIDKRIKPGSGIGSSAASSAGAVWAMNTLLGNPFSRNQLVQFAMVGEKLASGVAHADNVAPALFGGCTLIRSQSPLDIVAIPTPAELAISVIHPQIEVKTSDAREILRTNVPLNTAIKQWGNVGGLISGFFMDDYDLIGRALQDHIVEPIRSILIPGFEKLKMNALKAGALGGGISGSGPSVFALSKGLETAEKVSEAMGSSYQELGIPFEIHISKVNREGVKIISQL